MREVDAAKESISGELQSCRETIAVLWEECCDLRSLADRERELNREVKQETPSLRHSVEMALDISATQLEQASEEDLAFLHRPVGVQRDEAEGANEQAAVDAEGRETLLCLPGRS